MRFLRKRLENIKVVDSKPSDPNRVYFGAWVTLEDEAGGELRYRIVGPDEFDTESSYISMDSPLAKALLGKPIDSDVVVQTPKGEKEYFIVGVQYD